MAENTNTERDRAIMEGERNASLEAYRYGAWPCTAAMERSYEAGFTNGWERRAPLSPPAAGQEPVAYAMFADGGNIRLWSQKPIAHPNAVPLYAAPQPAVAAGWPLIARALDEWHEDDGPVMWWAWNGSAAGWAGEPAWCGTPLSSDWPGYHTHWTPHPTLPPAPSTEGERNADQA